MKMLTMRIRAFNLVRRNRLDLVGLMAGVAVVVAFHASGASTSTRDTFEFMGFDTDRALLITAGIGAAMASATAALVGAGRWAWPTGGLLGLVALFGRTYLAESQRALRGNPALGHFDPGGWLLTTASLVAAGMVIGLSAGILAAESRNGLVRLGRSLREAREARSAGAIPGGRIAIAALLIASLVVATPVIGQLLNYGPDSLMWSGGGTGIPIIGNGSGGPTPPGSGAIPSPGPTSSGGAVGPPNPSRPWLAWRPSGSGTVLEQTLPAPWTGGSSTVVHFSVYLPPGYQQGIRRYPVVYELPWPIALFDNGARIRPTLDSLTDFGAIPAALFVFLSSGGGPFVDNECLDAAGRREWFDTFAATTLVRYIDDSFRTIATPQARTLLGDSQGGFCAANVLLHHPDVFRQEVSFSGYYYAAPILGISPSAQAPYAGDAGLERSNSPMLIAANVPVGLRSRMLLVLVGNPAQPFYGSQLTNFSTLARRLGYTVTKLVTPLGHSWIAVRANLPLALEAVAAQEVAQGAFATSWQDNTTVPAG